MLTFLLLLACPQDKGTPSPDTQGIDRSPDAPDDAWMASVPQQYIDGVEGNEHGGYTLVFNPDLKDAITAYGDCGSILQSCLQERSGDFTTCVHTVAICQTAEPWNEGPCCPAACETRYDSLIAGGAAPFDAYVTTYALQPDCFPGLEEGP